MPIFNPPIITQYNRVDSIDAAYRRANIDPPTRAVPFAELVRDAPDVHTVATQISRTAHTSNADVDTLYSDAIEQIKNAIAADTLRQAYSRANEAVTHEQLPGMTDRAAHDLQAAVTRTADALAKAATRLDNDEPFSLERAVDTDTTKELKIARAALADLAVYAGIHETRTAGAARAGGIIGAIRILELPECVVEQFTGGTLREETTNAHETAGTLTVRELDREFHDNPDLALINIARGRHEGVRINLATTETMHQRWLALQRAFTRTRANTNQTRILR